MPGADVSHLLYKYLMACPSRLLRVAWAKQLELVKCIGIPIVVAVPKPTDEAMVIRRHLQLAAKERTAARLLDSVVRCEKVGSRRRSCPSTPPTGGTQFRATKLRKVEGGSFELKRLLSCEQGWREVTTVAPTQLARTKVARVQLFCSFEECCQVMNWRRACLR